MNSDVIHLLPDSVANQIAAGEVIQRPASVIKELVENSVDAGAKNIDIIIKDAGKSLIQVVDDGIGMSVTDARMAFERHATSKIRCADDLFTLHTMGFRGEALPSVAAVSEIEVNTRRPDDELGTRLVIRASRVESQEPEMTAPGTNIKVKNLFYNFVARRRFLKKDSIELSHIVHEFERLALVNTDVAFRFTSNGILLHSLPRGPLKDRITSLFGKSVSTHLIPVSTETSLVSIDGFVSLPEGARTRGQRQFLFVNGRNMRHPYFHRAIMSCFENLIPKDAQPHYFINFNVAPDRIDVNIHPQKHEIKFEDEQSIWQILTASIREALGRYNATSSIDFNSAGAPEIPNFGHSANTPENLNGLTDDTALAYNPFMTGRDDNHDSRVQSRLDFGNYNTKSPSGSRPSSLNHNNRATDPTGWEEFYKSLEKQRIAASAQADFNTPTDKPLIADNAENRPVFQLRNKYIVTEDKDGVIIFDQHRAHVNILFQQLKDATCDAASVPSQALLFDEPLDLDAQEQIMLDSSIDIMERIGFRIENDSRGRSILRGIPSLIGDTPPVPVLKTILCDMMETGVDVHTDILNNVLLSMARATALRGGQTLTIAEMQHLVAQLLLTPTPAYTPDGLKTMTRLTDDNLASLLL